ncbi:MAG: hypothetical protein KatS3mg102_0261 [Planctomycetota bacterium]|nr:MAG: hypothetical protein KatS3mg102_0261 [Planctomycetota bacterium]
MRYLTAELPPVRGGFRECAEDFEVEEVPAYGASGTGEHLYLWIEKRGISTHEAVRRLGRRLGRPARAFGWAGLKDARAVARQALTVAGVRPEAARGLELPGVRVLSCAPHRNKLRRGHLRANRFRVRLRGVPAGDIGVAEQVLARLEAAGVPNRFGAQRFGGSGEAALTHQLGLRLLRGEAEQFVRLLLGGARARAGRAPAAGARALRGGGLCRRRWRRCRPRRWPSGRRWRRWYAVGTRARRCARCRVRSRSCTSRRRRHTCSTACWQRGWQAGTLGRLRHGDVAWLHASGGCFVVEDPAAEQPRADRWEISPAGPLFGTQAARRAGRGRGRRGGRIRGGRVGRLAPGRRRGAGTVQGSSRRAPALPGAARTAPVAAAGR